MTKRTPPDPLTLDRMVLGTDEEHELDAWQSLLASPDAAATWAAAVERRQRVDALASVIAGQPWLATLMLGWRQTMRRAPTLASWRAVVHVAHPLTASLAGVDRREITLTPGAAEVLALSLGEGVSVSLPQGATLRQVTRLGVQPMDLSGWTMEAGDAPVVLVAVRASDGATLATVILVESQSEKTDP